MSKNNKKDNVASNESLNGLEDHDYSEDLAESDVSEESELEVTQEKISELEAALLRKTADLDNAIKRSITEIERAHKYGVEKLLNELLPIIDNLEHALNNFSKNVSTEDREGRECQK